MYLQLGGYMRSLTRQALLFLLVCFSASANLPDPLACFNNIVALDGAKQQLQIDRGLKQGDPVEPTMLTQYFSKDVLHLCPAGGSYTIGVIGQKPVCSIPAHSESEVERFVAQQRQPHFPWLLFAGRFVLFGAILFGVLFVVRRVTNHYRQQPPGRGSNGS